MSSISDSSGSADPAVAPNPKDKKHKWARGKHMTPAKRAKQFSDVMEVRGDCMWCLGLVDAKNRQSASKGLRQAAICLFCNGDVEERFSKL